MPQARSFTGDAIKPIYRRGLLPALALFALFAALTFYVAAATQKAQEDSRRRDFEALADHIFDDLGARLMVRLRGLSAIQRMISEGVISNDDSFDHAAQVLFETGAYYLAINLIDDARRIVRVWPEEPNRNALGRIVGESEGVRALLQTARDTGKPQLTGLVTLFQGGQGVVGYFPIARDGKFLGYVNGVFRIEGLENLLSDRDSAAVSVSFVAVADSSAPTASAQTLGPGRRQYALPVFNQTFFLELNRSDIGAISSKAAAEFVFGMVVSLVAAVLLFLLLVARSEAARSAIMLTGILRTAPIAVISTDANGRITLFNPAAEAMFQRTSASMIGQQLDMLLPPDTAVVHRDHLRGFAKGAPPAESMADWRMVSGRRANGEEFPVMVSLGRSVFEGGLIFTAMLRDMTESARMEAKMAQLADERSRQAERAEAANRAKTMFLASMSHELRTPLNAIIGFSELISQEVYGPVGHAKYKEYLDDICNSARGLLGIINDILDISKMEAGAYRFVLDQTDIVEVLRETAKLVAPLVLEKGLTLSMEGLPAASEAYADPRAVRQIALNLLSNAVKFTNPRGQVSIGLARNDAAGTLEFFVEDTGCGISTEDLERIGRPFVQVGDAYRSEVKGTGLGLSISRALAEGMQGQLAITSTPGVGTRVTVSLPLRRPEAVVRN